MTDLINGSAPAQFSGGPPTPFGDARPGVMTNAGLAHGGSTAMVPPVMFAASSPQGTNPFIPSGMRRRAPMHSDGAVGQEIRELRRGQGRTLKDLARAIGVTGAQLHRYETGTTRIAASRLIAIGNALGVGADALISAGYRESSHVAAPASFPGFSAQSSDDIVEMIELFGIITDVRHRSALLAVARMMAAQYPRDGSADKA